MISIPLLFLILSIALGSGITLYLFHRREERSAVIDRWLGVMIAFMVVYKLSPLIMDPSLILKPLHLLIIRGGDLGLLLGFLAAIAYWFWTHIRRGEELVSQWILLVLGIVASYTLYALIMWEVYLGQPLGLYRGLLGVLFIIVAKWKPNWFELSLMLYAGLILVVEGLGYGRLVWGLSLIQWFMLSLVLIYLILRGIARKEQVK